jgi:asparagine synthase (glutamine-hydrolysing)
LVTHGRCVLAVTNDPTYEEACVGIDDGWAAAITGRLDNAADVARRLSRRGPSSQAPSPATILARAFGELGDDVPNLLRGAFAAVVTDGRRMWCFRDHVGFETLFFRRDARGAFVASEAKQVVAGSGCPREPDQEVLEQIFYDDVEDHTRCALQGVRRILAGGILSADGGPARWRWYWHPERVLESASFPHDELPSRFEDVMSLAVTRMLGGADAASLSGGIDSPAIAAFGAPQHRRRFGRSLMALSAVYPDFPSADELPFIEEVASALDMPLHTYRPRPQRLTRLRDWVQLFDGPWPTWSPSGAEQRLGVARDLGLRTLLDGNLAEQVMAMQRFLVAHLSATGRIGVALRYLRRDRAEGASLRRIARQLVSPFVPGWAVAAYLRRNPLMAVPPWLSRERVNAARVKAARPLRRMWMEAQLAGFRGSSLPLEASATLYSIFGVRERMPWGDVDLWEFFLSLPAEIKFPHPQMKSLVRGLLRGRVPDRILQRQDKTVLNEWFEATSLDYPSLRRWLLRPSYRVPGVDYGMLAERLERCDMDLAEYVWAKDLAGVHAFLDLW